VAIDSRGAGDLLDEGFGVDESQLVDGGVARRDLCHPP
jgi:hypothetical protein